MNEITTKLLIETARRARENSYSPYSHFKVGAALLSADGKIYPGCNFESVAFGAGVCAERVALGNAIADGKRAFTAIAVCGAGNITPCGICRQALAEFGDIDVICIGESGDSYRHYRLSELLPNSFNSI